MLGIVLQNLDENKGFQDFFSGYLVFHEFCKRVTGEKHPIFLHICGKLGSNLVGVCSQGKPLSDPFKYRQTNYFRSIPRLWLVASWLPFREIAQLSARFQKSFCMISALMLPRLAAAASK